MTTVLLPPTTYAPATDTIEMPAVAPATVEMSVIFDLPPAVVPVRRSLINRVRGAAYLTVTLVAGVGCYLADLGGAL